jgi:transcriptional regulator with XRE-family HTH domain
MKNNLKILRELNGFSQTELSKITGIHRTTISKYEQDNEEKEIRDISQKHAHVLTDVLSASYEELLNGDKGIDDSPSITHLLFKRIFPKIISSKRYKSETDYTIIDIEDIENEIPYLDEEYPILCTDKFCFEFILEIEESQDLKLINDDLYNSKIEKLDIKYNKSLKKGEQLLNCYLLTGEQLKNIIITTVKKRKMLENLDNILNG